MNKEIIERYLKGCNLRTLSKECGIGENNLSKQLKDAGVLRSRGGVTRHTYDNHAFDIITEQSAYWIGFLMADGSITKQKTQKTKYLSLRLAKQDINQVIKLKHYLKASCPITSRANTGFKGQDISYIGLTASDHLITTLASHGVTQNKTITATASKELEFNRDFWRGMVDGDGWITLQPQRQLPCIGLCGSKTICEQFARYAKSVDWTCESKVIPSTNSTICYRFQTAGSHAQLLIENLYKNCTVALDRKLKLANRWIDDPYKQKETIWTKTVSDFPEVASQWHPTKNTTTPDKVAFGSAEKVWWLCSCGHEWEAHPNNRINRKSGCPIRRNHKFGSR